MTLAISTVCFHLFLKQSEEDNSQRVCVFVCVFNPREFGCYGAISKVKSSINSLSLSFEFFLRCFRKLKRKCRGFRCVDKREKKESVCVKHKAEYRRSETRKSSD